MVRLCFFFLKTIESFAAQEKQMEVCEVCGAFLIVGDAQSRVDDHLMGKQHMGYAKIKSTVEELKVMGSPGTKNADMDKTVWFEMMNFFLINKELAHLCLGEITSALRRPTR